MTDLVRPKVALLVVLLGFVIGSLGVLTSAQPPSGIISVEFLKPTFSNQAQQISGTSVEVRLNITCSGTAFIDVEILQLGVSEREFIGCASGTVNDPIDIVAVIDLKIPESAPTGVYDITASWGFINQIRCSLCVIVVSPVYELHIGEAIVAGESTIQVPISISGPGDLSLVKLDFQVRSVNGLFPRAEFVSAAAGPNLALASFGENGVAAQVQISDVDDNFDSSTRRVIDVVVLTLDVLSPGEIEISARPSGFGLNGPIVALVRDGGVPVVAHEIKSAQAVIELQ